VPQGRWEWATFVAGVSICAVLLVLIAVNHRPRAATSAQEAVTATTVPRPQTTTATPSSAAKPTTTTARPREKPAQPVVIRLMAREDTWISVRRTPSSAPVYEGTLVAGASKTFSGASFRIRFGGAANVSAVLNGSPLRLPGGTYSVTIGPSGLGARSA
jgi:hypothetical protein